LVEWNRRLDDFERKGWRNVCQVVGAPSVEYVGITNREDDAEDRAVVRIEAVLTDYVVDEHGHKITRGDSTSETSSMCEYWTLAWNEERNHWTVVSIEQQAEGDHHLDGEIVPTPWSDGRIADEALVEGAVADKVAEGFTVADVADLDFDGDARAAALDLSVADTRFGPDVLEAAARRAVEAWAEAVDGEDAALEAVASPEAVARLLYGDDSSASTRVVVRGPRVKRIHIAALDAGSEPATMTIDVEVQGRRYRENRDTAAVVSGSQSRATTFTERWTLALEGPDTAPWRLVGTATPGLTPSAAGRAADAAPRATGA
jgi:predicted lipid-binding transport protein (Tim44 family)